MNKMTATQMMSQKYEGVLDMARGYTVLVIEESDILREKIAGLISRQQRVDLVAQVSSRERLAGALAVMTPDIVFADVAFARFARFHFQNLQIRNPNIKIVLYTSENGHEYQQQARDLGADILTDTLRIQDAIRVLFHMPGPLDQSILVPGGRQ